MKFTNTQGSVLEMDPSIEKGQFGLEINSKSFSVLTDNIYSDKIKAVIRELGCNGWDSHKEAGNKNPIEIHLPTREEPYFYIQDYGVGLSKEDILAVYINFFASTKDKSNKYTGSLGIGAKSFFSYHTKSCTIEAVKDGVKVIYNCFLEEGVPSYAKLGEFETDDPTGVKIQFAVNKNDIYAFEKKAADVFQWFETKPKFIGKQLDIKEVTKLTSGNGWYLSNDSSKLVMGNIAYDIESGETGLDKYSMFINSPIIIEAKLGQVEFNSSREGLSYTKKTVAFLQMKYSQIKEELCSKIEEEISSCKNYYEACCKSHILHKSLPYHLRNIVDFNNIKYNSNKLIDNLRIKIAGVLITKYEYCNWRSPKKIERQTLEYDDNQLVIVDIKKGQHLRAKEYCAANKKNVYLISFDEEVNKDCKKEFFDLVKCDSSNYILASSISYTPTKSTSNRNSLTSIMKYNGDYRTSKSWDAVSLDITKTKGTYVIRNGYQFFDNLSNKFESSTRISFYLDKFKSLNISFDVYAITKKDEQKFIDAGWSEFKETLSKKIDNNKKIVDELSRIDYYTGNSNYRLINAMKYIPELKKTLDLYKKILGYKKQGNFDFVGVESLFNDSLKKEIEKSRKEKEKEAKELDSEFEVLSKKYPLLNSYVEAGMTKELYFYYKGKSL